MAIGVDDIETHYVTIAEARRMHGLRVVLGAFAIPGPWHEACKGICHVKGLDYTPVHSANAGASDAMIGMAGSQSELVEWTAQSSAPVMIWNDERPRSMWNDQLYLAERLAPEPHLIPDDSADRVLVFGFANELMGEGGLNHHKRHFMSGPHLESLPEDSPERVLFTFLGRKYGYSDAVLARATRRICEILGALDAQLADQRARGRSYLVGDRLSALDIYWAATCGFLDPMPEERCPMADAFRAPNLYGAPNSEIDRALSAALREHRDLVYERHLELPIVF